MPSLIGSSMILAFARLTNYALLMLSPVLLVRILDQQQFGQYREFMAYAMLIASVAAFSISSNLLYFIPKERGRAPLFVSHTNWLILGASLMTCLVLLTLRGPLMANMSYDFFVPLIVFVALFISLSYLETYWIATKRPRNVLYYSTGRTVLRLGTVVLVALATRSVQAILIGLILVEVLRVLVVLIISLRLRLLSWSLDFPTLRSQLAFIVPLGLATSLHHVNHYIGHIVVATQLGVVALAIYAIGATQVPVLRIVRGAVSDAIFPDMVREAETEADDRLRLWRRGNIAFSILIVPIVVILMWYAGYLIPLVFTEEYVEAVPIFRILLAVLVVQCFELSSPLRAINRTRPLLYANVVMVLTNATCIALFFLFLEDFALFGPAWGMLFGQVVQHVFLAYLIIQAFTIDLAKLLKWRSLLAIAASAALGLPVLIAGELVPIPELARFILCAPLFLVVYFVILRRRRLEELEALAERCRHTLRGWAKRPSFSRTP